MQPPTTIEELIELCRAQDELLHIATDTCKINERTINVLLEAIEKLKTALTARNAQLTEAVKVIDEQTSTMKMQNEAIIKLGKMVGIKPPDPELPN